MATRSTFNILLPAVDRARARALAQKLAEGLGSKVKREARIVVGEPRSLYSVPCHLKQFWCKAKVSDDTVVYSSESKRGAGDFSPYCFTLSPWRNMATHVEVPDTIQLIGCPVYRQEFVEPSLIVEALNPKQIRTELRDIVRSGVSFLFCSATQVSAEFEARAIEPVIEQIRRFQRLQMSLFERSARRAQPGATDNPGDAQRLREDH